MARCAFGEEDSSRRCEDGGRVLEAQAQGFLPGWEGRAGPRAVPLGRDTDNEAPERQARSLAAGTGSSSHASPTFQEVLALSFHGPSLQWPRVARVFPCGCENKCPEPGCQWYFTPEFTSSSGSLS